MKTIVLTRLVYEPEQTLGVINVYEGTKHLFHCKTLELPNKNNERGKSSIPASSYKLEFEYSPKFHRKLWELKGVPGRSEIKIHAGNYARQIQGCILVGDFHLDIDNNGSRDVRNSRNTLKRLHKTLENESNLEIRVLDS
jgi:hypothetical protein